MSLTDRITCAEKVELMAFGWPYCICSSPQYFNPV